MRSMEAVESRKARQGDVRWWGFSVEVSRSSVIYLAWFWLLDEFELSGYSVFSVLRLAVRGHLVQAMFLAPFEDVESRSFGPPPCVVPSHYVVGVDGIEVAGC